MRVPEPLHLLPPHRHQLLRIQHDMVPIRELLRVVHRPLVDVALNCARMARVLAGRDLHPVAMDRTVVSGHAAGEGLGVRIFLIWHNASAQEIPCSED